MEPTTSRLRLGLCAAIVRTAWNHYDGGYRIWLKHQLEDRPFTARTDDELVEMAEKLEVPNLGEIAAMDPTRYPMEARYMCNACQDARHVPDHEGRYKRCPQCNQRGVASEEPAASA